VTDFSIDPGTVAPALDTVFSQLNREGFADKLWARQTDLWSSDYGVGRAIANRLGWLDGAAFARSASPTSCCSAWVGRVSRPKFSTASLDETATCRDSACSIRRILRPSARR
jgi:hypothetical protein